MNDFPFDLPRPTDSTPADRLIQLYIAGECTLAERIAMERWIAANPVFGATFRAMRVDGETQASLAGTAGKVARGTRAVLGAVPAGTLASDRTHQKIVGAVVSRRILSSGVAIPKLKHLLSRDRVSVRENSARHGLRGVEGLGTRTLRRWLWVGTAAMITGIGFLTHRVHGPPSDMVRVYATHAYQQAFVNLDEGTRVTLAPQTTLRVLPFKTGARTVTLERGEAYFEVAHAAETPFVVRSGATTTEVLGTAFLIRYDPHNPHVRVAVTDGKVRITTAAHDVSGVVLNTGQVGDVIDSTTSVTTANDLTPGTEWAPGRVIFRDTPLKVVLQTVTRWYGYQFRYADTALGAQSVTMTVSTRSSAEALAAIERVVAVNLTVVGDTVTLVPQPPRSSHDAPRIRTYDVWSPSREVGR